MILYVFYMILYDFYMILYGFYMILYGFYMILYGFILFYSGYQKIPEDHENQKKLDTPPPGLQETPFFGRDPQFFYFFCSDLDPQKVS